MRLDTILIIVWGIIVTYCIYLKYNRRICIFCRICIFLHITVFRKDSFIIAQGTWLTDADISRVHGRWLPEALRRKCLINVDINKETNYNTMSVKRQGLRKEV